MCVYQHISNIASVCDYFDDMFRSNVIESNEIKIQDIKPLIDYQKLILQKHKPNISTMG